MTPTAESDAVVACVLCDTFHTGPCPRPSAEKDAPEHDGCDCAELCSMGPTCPGGMLARLPGSGCHRTAEEPVRAALRAFVESDAVRYAVTVAGVGHRAEADARLRDAAEQQADQSYSTGVIPPAVAPQPEEAS